MIKRQIIKIDDELCNGCGICVDACHEGAIQLVDGKAKLLREDYCDGLGDCIGECPTKAISFVSKETLPFDKEAVLSNMAKMNPHNTHHTCPGSRVVDLKEKSTKVKLNNWPVQLKLVPPTASYFNGCDLLVCADCCSYSYANFHNVFLKDKVLLIGCPKLDDTEYMHKLQDIISLNNINTITLLRMEVPCCGGLEYQLKQAISNSNKNVPLFVHTISIDGEII